MMIATKAMACAAVLCAALMQGAWAQSNPTYLPFGPAKGVLYKPDAGKPPHVALVIMHRTANYLYHTGCRELSARGFMVLCMNNRYENNEIAVRWEQVPLDVKSGVAFLRKQPGITKVILFGHSGGGPTMSFYQAVAENGTAYCKGANKLVECEEDLAGLPRADGIVFADAHPGNPVVMMRGINPSVIGENFAPAGVDASLDPFDTRNGYSAGGPSRFSKEFEARYYRGQSERINTLIATAQSRMERIRKGQYPYPDNDLIVMPGAGNPGPGPGGSVYLNALDPNLSLNSTVREQKLLRNDGSVVRQIVKSVIAPDRIAIRTNRAFDTGTKLFSLRSFLSANAIRSTNSLDGIDHCSSNNSTVCAVQSISVPVLFAAMGAFVFIRDNEIHYELAKSADKDFVVIEGANHGFTPCTECERSPGQYANALRNFYDHVRDWINARY